MCITVLGTERFLWKESKLNHLLKLKKNYNIWILRKVPEDKSN